MSKRTKLIKDLQENGLTINLMITEFCNFSCSRCFYGSSPLRPSQYMTEEQIDRVIQIVKGMDQLGIRCNINLIGGEPTIKLEEFKRVLEHILICENYNATFEMTTNEWWIGHDKHMTTFLEIVQESGALRLINDELFHIRISDSDYHDDHRPKYQRNVKNLGEFLKNILESPCDYLDPEFYECSECGEGVDRDAYEDNDEICPECGEQSYLDAYFPHRELYQSFSELEHGFYVQDQRSQWSTSASNPQNIGIDKSSDHCIDGTIISYRTNGITGDFCCNGSDLKIGTMWDDPIGLLLKAKRFLKQCKPTCRDCVMTAESWIEESNIKIDLRGIIPVK